LTLITRGTQYALPRRDLSAGYEKAPSELRAVDPLGKSPVIEDGDLVLAESGAIIEYLLERQDDGRLVPTRGTNDHVRYLRSFLPKRATISRRGTNGITVDSDVAACITSSSYLYLFVVTGSDD
jgi:glutathione S-transferase